MQAAQYTFHIGMQLACASKDRRIHQFLDAVLLDVVLVLLTAVLPGLVQNLTCRVQAQLRYWLCSVVQKQVFNSVVPYAPYASRNESFPI